MSTSTVALLTISSLSLITSVATLTIVLVGGKKAHAEIENVRTKTNTTLSKFKSALETLEI